MNKMRLFLLCVMAACCTLQAGAAELLWELHPGKKRVLVDKPKGVKVRFLDKKCAEIRDGRICTGEQVRLQWNQIGRCVSMDEPCSMVVRMKADWESSGSRWPVMFSMGESIEYNIKASADKEADLYAVDREHYSWQEDDQECNGRLREPAMLTFILYCNGRGGYSLSVDGDEVAILKIDDEHVRDDRKVQWFSLGGRLIQDNNLCPVEVEYIRFYKGKVDEMSLFMTDNGIWVYTGIGVLALLAAGLLAWLVARRRKKSS